MAIFYHTKLAKVKQKVGVSWSRIMRESVCCARRRGVCCFFYFSPSFAFFGVLAFHTIQHNAKGKSHLPVAFCSPVHHAKFHCFFVTFRQSIFSASQNVNLIYPLEGRLQKKALEAVSSVLSFLLCILHNFKAFFSTPPNGGKITSN
jgi:hypothetical protein